jgi:hypothetical protein
LVDDEPDVRRHCATFLASRGLVVREALICEVRHQAASGRQVFLAGRGGIGGAVHAHSSSDYEYLDLSSGPEGLLRGVQAPGAAVAAARPSSGLVAESPAMRALQERIARVADVDSTVVLTGESGTGKETVARAIFRAAAHRRHEFVPVNCGAIPEGLFESELFGYKRGGFTGAVADNEGMVQKAEQGVLFLDEIGDMPIAMQVRLLRFLDSGEYRRVGDPTLRRAHVPISAATNRPLERDIAEGRFRLDLFTDHEDTGRGRAPQDPREPLRAHLDRTTRRRGANAADLAAGGAVAIPDECGLRARESVDGLHDDLLGVGRVRVSHGLLTARSRSRRVD